MADAELQLRITTTVNDSAFKQLLGHVANLNKQLKGLNDLKGVGDNLKGIQTQLVRISMAAESVNKALGSAGRKGGFKQFDQNVKALQKNLQGMTPTVQKATSSVNQNTQAVAGNTTAMKQNAAAGKNLVQTASAIANSSQKRTRTLTSEAAAIKSVTSRFQDFSKAQKQYEQASDKLANARTMRTQLIQREEAATKALAAAQDRLNRAKRVGDKEEAKVAGIETTQIRQDLRRIASELSRADRDIEAAERGIIQSVRGLRRAFDGLDGVTSVITTKTARGREALAKAYDIKNLAPQILNDVKSLNSKVVNEAMQIDSKIARNRGMTQWAQNISVGARNAASAITQMMRGITSQGAAASRAASTLSNNFKQLVQIVQQLARSIAGTLTSAIRTASNMLGNFGSGAAARFASLRSALDATGRSFLSFGQDARRGMNTATSSMIDGYALMMTGSRLNQMGQMGMNYIGRGFQGYADIERSVARTALAGLEYDRQGQLTGGVNLDAVWELVYGMQRGEFGTVPIRSLSTHELADATYFLTSAIGAPINRGTYSAIATMLTPMAINASATLTNPETYIKGVLGIGQQFGYNPRDFANPRSAQQFANIANLVGYMANISSMEPTDLIETMKMVGPSMYNMYGARPQVREKALLETFLATFAASEVGLRGSQVGRAYQRVGSGLMDPTANTIEVMARAFGFDPTVEDYEKFLFNDAGLIDIDGHGQGLLGLASVLRQYRTEHGEGAYQKLMYELFTENATRGMVATIAGMDSETFEEVQSAVMAGDYATATSLFSQAVELESQLVSNAVQNMQNAFGQLFATITNASKGTIIGGLDFLSNILREISDIIMDFPELGNIITGLAAGLSTFAMVAGGILSAAGALIVFQRAAVGLGIGLRAMLTGLVSLPVMFASMIPLLLLLAGAAVALKVAWDNNFLGMRDAVEKLKSTLSGDFSTGLLQFLNGDKARETYAWIMRIGSAFKELVSGIIFNTGHTPNLFALMNTVFGPRMGNVINNNLQRVRLGLRDLRDELSDTVAAFAGSLPALSDFWRSAVAVMEQVFTGGMHPDSRAAVSRIGEWLGIEDLDVHVGQIGSRIAEGLNSAVRHVLNFASTVRSILSNIFSNLGQIFTFENILAGLSVAVSFIQGVFAGMGAVILAALRGIEMFTRGLTNLGSAGRHVAELVNEFTGLELTIHRVSMAMGVLVGSWFGARLIGPLLTASTMFNNMALSATHFSLGLVEVGIRIAATVGQILLMATAYGIYAAIMGTVALAEMSVNAAKFAHATMNAMIAATQVTVNGVMLATTAILFSMAAAFAAVAMVALGVVGAMLVYVAATEGLNAAMAALGQFIAGMLAVLIPVGQVMFAVAEAAFNLASALASAIGFGEGFYGVGVMIGVMLAGVVAMLAATAAAAVMAGIAMMVSFGPVGIAVMAIVAAIGLFVGALAAALVQTQDFGNAMLLVFTWLAEGVVKAFDFIINDVIIGGLEKVLQYTWDTFAPGPLRNALQEAIPGFEDGKISIGRWGLLEEIDDALDFVQDGIKVKGLQTGENFMQGIMEGIRGTPLEGIMDTVMGALGMDPNNPNWADFDLTKLIGTPDFDATMSAFDNYDYLLPHWYRDYIQDVQEWDEWMKNVEFFGSENLAAQFYELNNIPIPDKPNLDDYINGVNEDADDLNEAAQKLAEANQAYLDAIRGFESPTALLAHRIDQDMANGGIGGSVAGFLQQFGDQILENAGEHEWLNLNELFADVAGAGKLDANLLGQNVHDAMKPALEIVSRQTGKSINELLKDVPKWIAPQEFINLAGTEILQGLNKMPQHVYERLDEFGVAEGWTQFGLDWTDLINFAASKAAAGMEWDFTDYLRESLGLSNAEVQQALDNYDIDASVISSEWMEETENLRLTMNGQLTVLTEDMLAQAELLAASAEGAYGNVIRVTKEQLENLPPEVKAYLDSLGMVFVLDDTADDITNWGDGVVAAANGLRGKLEEAHRNLYGIDPWGEGYIGPDIASPFDPGDGPISDAALRRPSSGAYTSPVSSGVIQGPTVEMNVEANTSPAVQTVNQFQREVDGTEATVKVNVEPQVGNVNVAPIQGPTLGGQGAIQGPPAPGGSGAFASIAQQYAQQLATELETALSEALSEAMPTAFSNAMSNAFSGEGISAEGGEEVWTSWATAQATAAGDALDTAFSELLPARVASALSTSLTGEGGGLTEEGVSGIWTAWATTQANAAGDAIQEQFGTILPARVASALALALSGEGEGGEGGGGEAMWTAWATAQALYAAEAFTTAWDSTVKPAIETKMTELDAYMQGGSGEGGAFTATLDLETGPFDAALDMANKAVNDTVSRTYTVVLEGENKGAMGAIEDVQKAVDALVGDYTVNIVANNYASSVIATVASELAILNGRTATTYVYTKRVGDERSDHARGGYVWSDYQLVGEEGPELVRLPRGSYVYTADQTSRMLKESVNRSLSEAGNTDIRSGGVNPAMHVTHTINVQNAPINNPKAKESSKDEITINLYGNVTIGSQQDLDALVDQIDRRLGRKHRFALRGQEAVDYRSHMD